MSTDRKFTRFNRGKSTTSGAADESPLSLKEIPDGGLCLSTFLLISEANSMESILMGRIDPLAPWDHIGALDSRRLEMYRKGWMLPSSHLIVHESPQAASQRIALEQLDLNAVKLSDPKIFSEVYPPKSFPNLPKHWDLEIIFQIVIPFSARRSRAFRELKFIKPEETRKSEIARSHEDILESLGYRFLD